MTKCECIAVLDKKDPRAEIWKKIVPDLRLPLKHPIPHRATATDLSPVAFYECELERLTNEQRDQLAELMAAEFELDIQYVRTTFKKGILPILDKNITVVICPLHTRMMI